MTDETAKNSVSVADEPVELDHDFIQNPLAAYRQLRDEAPVRAAFMPRGQFKIWLVTRYADAKSLLADPRLSKDSVRARQLIQSQAGQPGEDSPVGAALTGHMLNSDPPTHTRLRKLVNKAFTARTVSRLRPRIEQITADLLEDLAAAGSVDLLESFAFPLPTIVICELLGVPVGDRDAFGAWTNTLVTASDLEALRRDAAAMAGYLTELIADKRRAPTEDLLSELVHVSDEGDRLTEAELLPMAFLLLAAGHETTVNLIGNSVLALLRNPDQLAALRADPSLMPNAIEEFLRFDGPVHIATLRFTTEPVRVGDVEIPEGEFVMISLLAANHDENRFAEPDRLDVTRPAGGHLAFGHGIHYCVGAPLARLEAEVALGGLLRRFNTIDLDGEPESLIWRESTLIHGLKTLPVRVS